MDLHSLHLYLELTAAACLFFIAWINLKYKATGIYSNLMGIGITIAAVTDLTHALIHGFYPWMAEHWMVMSWGASRITLVLTFLMVLLHHDIILRRLKTLAIVLATPLIFSIFVTVPAALGLGGFHWTAHDIDVYGTIIHSPFDFVLLLLWLITAIVLRNKSHILFPPHVYWLFMSQGIMVHVIMSFSSYSTLDMPSLLAHALKISEYYSFILIYLLYKSTLDRRAADFRETSYNNINTIALRNNVINKEID